MQAVVSWAKTRQAGTVAITHASRSALMADVGDLFEKREGFTLATLNLDHIVKLRRDRAFRDAYLAQSHVVADGNPIVWLSHLAGRRVELIPGSELVAPLAALAADRGVPVALFGASPDSLKGAADHLRGQYPDLEIVATISPPQGFDATGSAAKAYAQEIAATKARLVFLALGAPKQECFAALAAGINPQAGFVSIGAGLDFLAGTQRRAPAWARRLALEWLWRLLSHPRRLFARYAACIAILPGLTWQAWRSR